MATERAWWRLVISHEPDGPHDSSIELLGHEFAHIASLIEDEILEGEMKLTSYESIPPQEAGDSDG